MPIFVPRTGGGKVECGVYLVGGRCGCSGCGVGATF